MLTANLFDSSSSPTGTTRPLAVVAGDLTLSSVRSFLREAVPGCEEDSTTNCLIIDDMLHLIYDWDTFSGSGVVMGNSPRFLGRPVSSTDNLQTRVCCQERKILLCDWIFSLSLSLSLSLSPQYQGVLSDLVRRVGATSSLIKKNQCVDYYSTDIETRRFYQLDTSLDGVFRNDPGYCVDYRVSGWSWRPLPDIDLTHYNIIIQ